jgi:putative glutamine amidotransferase
MNPIIGITSGQPTIKTSGGEERAHVVNQVYTDAVMRSGGTSILLPPVSPDEAPRILDRIDGLLLSGGGDVDPSFYGGKLHDDMYEIDHDRDVFEFALVGEARRRRMPTLAICRGLQVLNVALGGSLIEDIPSEIGSTDHAIRGPEVVDCHQTVRIESNTLVAKAIGAAEACVNSIHHQAVRNVAPGLRAAGWTDDNVVEVLDPDDHSWPLLAVQWHPEYLAVKDDEASLALFMTLVENARRSAQANSGIGSFGS